MDSNRIAGDPTGKRELRERLSESRRAFESELRFMPTEISAPAIRALNRARELRNRGDQPAAVQLRRLDEHRARLRELSEEARRGDA